MAADQSPAAFASVGGALGVGAIAAFYIRKTQGVKPLISLNRFGQLLVENGQFWVFNGQKPVVILVEL